MLTFILVVTCVLNLSVALLTLVSLRHRSAVTSDEAVASSPTRTAESRPSAPVISRKSGPASGHIGGVANGRDTEIGRAHV